MMGVNGGEDKDKRGVRGGGGSWEAYGISEYPQLRKDQSASFTYNQFSV